MTSLSIPPALNLSESNGLSWSSVPHGDLSKGRPFTSYSNPRSSLKRHFSSPQRLFLKVQELCLSDFLEIFPRNIPEANLLLNGAGQANSNPESRVRATAWRKFISAEVHEPREVRRNFREKKSAKKNVQRI